MFLQPLKVLMETNKFDNCWLENLIVFRCSKVYRCKLNVNKSPLTIHPPSFCYQKNCNNCALLPCPDKSAKSSLADFYDFTIFFQFLFLRTLVFFSSTEWPFPPCNLTLLVRNIFRRNWISVY